DPQSRSIGLTTGVSDFSARSSASLNFSSRMRERSFWLAISRSKRACISLFWLSRPATIESSEPLGLRSFTLCSSTSPERRSITRSDSQQGQVTSKFLAMAPQSLSRHAPFPRRGRQKGRRHRAAAARADEEVPLEDVAVAVDGLDVGAR